MSFKQIKQQQTTTINKQIIKRSFGSKKVPAPCSNKVFNELAQICSVCNESKIVYNEVPDTFENVGEPTEAALRVLVEKMQTDSSDFNSKLASMSKADRVQACNNYISEKFKKVNANKQIKQLKKKKKKKN